MEKSLNEYDEYSDIRKKIYGECPTCNRYNTNYSWCQSCNPRLLTEGWTSGNETLDELIKSSQLKVKAYDSDLYLQWIPYKDLKDTKVIGKGGFATIYIATWINGENFIGPTTNKRISKDLTVALKKLHNSQEISNEFLNEFKHYAKFRNRCIIKIYGLTQDPITKDYIIVMRYAKDGDLQSHLSKVHKNLKWSEKIFIIFRIIEGLQLIHEQDMVHRDLHSGNILQYKPTDDSHYNYNSYIADLGLSIPANQTSDKDDVFGVLPYVAPEVLRHKPYTMASDIYSFGVLMSVVSTGQQPFRYTSHDLDLAMRIFDGVRPEFSNNTPEFYIELAYSCMDADPENRPSAGEVKGFIVDWRNSFNDELINNSEHADKIDEWKFFRREFDKMDKIIFDPSKLSTTNAIYSSRLLNFPDLPQPINSNKVTIINNHDTKQIELCIPD